MCHVSISSVVPMGRRFRFLVRSAQFSKKRFWALWYWYLALFLSVLLYDLRLKAKTSWMIFFISVAWTYALQAWIIFWHSMSHMFTFLNIHHQTYCSCKFLIQPEEHSNKIKVCRFYGTFHQNICHTLLSLVIHTLHHKIGTLCNMKTTPCRYGTDANCFSSLWIICICTIVNDSFFYSLGSHAHR